MKKTPPQDFARFYFVDDDFIEAVIAVAAELPGHYGLELPEDTSRVQVGAAAAVEAGIRNQARRRR